MESFGSDVVETPGFGFSHSHIKSFLLHEFLPFSVFSTCFMANINYTNLTLGFQSAFVEIFNWLRILCMPIICSDPHPSPPIPPLSNSLVFLFNFLWSLFKSAEFTKGYQYVHGCRTIYWSVNSLPGTAFLKKMGSFSTNSCQLPITPQVGVEHHEHFVWHLVHVITATRNL